jgi:uncharacterized protein (TIGR02147 family)
MAKTASPHPAVSGFRFLDPREFLRQAYDVEKKRNRNFSHRFIAKSMNAGSSSFFKDVLCGRAPLNPARAAKFAKLFHLSPKETEHFENLVLFTQADTREEKERYLRKLGGESSSGQRAVLEASQREYLQKWHYAAIRELLDVHDFRDDYEALAKALDPAITADEARDAVELLQRLGLARKNAQGRYEKVSDIVSTRVGGDPETAKPGLLANIDLARRSLDAHPPAARPFSYLTFNVSERTFAEVRDRIRAFRREILNVVADDDDADRLYQLNLQFFPLSMPAKRRKS